jgi:hypothetical protein
LVWLLDELLARGLGLTAGGLTAEDAGSGANVTCTLKTG